MATATVSLDTLKALRLELGQSIRCFGLTLKRAVNPKAENGYSHAYILALESGKRPLTPDLAKAYQRIMAAHDGADPDAAVSQPMTVYAANDIAGCVVTGSARQCARPGCRVRFVPHNPAQRYHSAWCRKQINRQRQ